MTKNNHTYHNFPTEILKIEEDLLNFLVDSMINYSGRDPILSKTMVYFFTRNALTQKELQILTGFSAGTISKTIHQLMEMNLVQKEFIEKTHKHIYAMDELPYANPSYLLNVESLMGGISVKLENIKKKLDKIREFKDELDGFEKVDSISTQIMTVIKMVPQFVEILKIELEDYLKQYPEFTKEEEK